MGKNWYKKGDVLVDYYKVVHYFLLLKYSSRGRYEQCLPPLTKVLTINQSMIPS